MADRFWGSLLCWICFFLAAARANVQSKVRCSEETMEVDIVRSSPRARIYLQQLKDFPDETCKPRLSNGVATFRLSLLDQDMLRCGITRVVNKRTGQKVYYHRIIVEEPANPSKHTFTVKCVITEVVVQPPEISMTANHTTVRRSVLPAGFQESEDYDLGEPILRYAPSPTLNVGVRQGGVLVTNELNVSPGTPLQMEIYLDNSSAPIYGLLMTYMQVTDTKSQEETIIFNGCSVDPYLFENFNTVDGDFLVAKFRAFKFPESTFVQFHGTVNVCLDKCQGVECSNGQIGFGRRRRRAIQMGSDKNKIFEVTLSTTIKVDVAKNGMIGEVLSEFIRKGKNKRVTAEEISDVPSATTLRTEEKPMIDEEEKAMIGKETQEKFKYNLTAEEISGCARTGATTSLLISFILFCLCKAL